MEEINLSTQIDKAAGWFASNQDLLIQYAVNIVSAILILIVGLFIAKLGSKAVKRVMSLRGIDITISDFLSAIIRYAVIA
ncbi:mechanosensitive ion channel protein MscS, partial [Xenorhabdus bovienii]|uniref:mechanosensitive ion channel family protein n=1 Tax=Xenorhabdus bovienii TaxID=40576 RepID=UPI003BA9C947|nr:mechanosensitive ion channel protein MscS [Xenorhabdus bovienii]